MRGLVMIITCVIGGVGTGFSDSIYAAGGENATEILYQERCAVCHGQKGDGRGLAAHSMRVKPTDFTLGLYKYRSTPSGSPPLDADIERSIQSGIYGTSMPAWDDLLSSQEIKDVVKLLKGFASNKTGRAAAALTAPTEAEIGRANADKGKMLYQSSKCSQCHGNEGAGDGPLARQLKDARGNQSFPRDLTDHRNYATGQSITDIYFRIASGLNGTPMTGYANSLSRQQIVDISAYLKSLYEDKEKTRWTVKDTRDPQLRGEYLTNFMVCQLCHTPVNADGSYQNDVAFSGGMKITTPQDGLFFSRNITSDKESGIGKWTVEQIKDAITKGRTPDGRVLYVFDMPWFLFHYMEDEDARAIATYLKSSTPNYNKIPPAVVTSFWQSTIYKTKVLFNSAERELTYYNSNAGERNPEKGKLIPDHADPDASYWSIVPPVLTWLPEEKMADTVGFELPLPEKSSDPALDAKRLRGRYVITIAPCALCHTATAGRLALTAAAALSGGTRISWRTREFGFGTVYGKNLTPDPETGLGNWTDKQIRRAIRSGITKDGRGMHWQAMPWDQLTNLTEADVDAVIAYLRSMKPVRKSIPANGPAHTDNYVISDRDFGTFLDE